MSVGLALLKKVIEEGHSLGALLQHGITGEVLTKDETEVYTFIRNHVTTHGTLPKIRTLEKETGVKLGGFPDEPIGYWVDSVIKRARTSKMRHSITSIQELLAEGKVDSAELLAKGMAADLDRLGGDRVHKIHEVAPEIIHDHNVRQMSTRLSGISFGLPSLDRVSDGAQPGDVISIIGETEIGKSYMLLRVALSAYLDGETPLVVSMEMPPKQCFRRVLAMYAGVSATKIRVGRLSFWGRKRLMEAMDEMRREAGGRAFNLTEGALSSTIEDVIVRVQELRPTVLYVDGAYLLRTVQRYGAKWEQVTAIAEQLKIIAKEFEIPIIATYQFNRKGAGSIHNIGLSAAIGQLSSIVLELDHLYETDADGKKTPDKGKRVLSLLKGREGEWGQLALRYDVKDRMRIEEMTVLKGFELLG